jgi:hypothetical protein
MLRGGHRESRADGDPGGYRKVDHVVGHELRDCAVVPSGGCGLHPSEQCVGETTRRAVFRT